MRDNKHVVMAFFDALNDKKLEVLPTLAHPELPGGTAGLQVGLGALLSAVPDIRYTLHDVLAEGDKVAVRWSWTGTQSAPFRNYPASGARVTDGGFGVFGVRDGKLASIEILTDRLGFLEQIGMGPASAAVIDPRRAPNGVYLIDTFIVPDAHREEFEAATKRNRDFIRKLDGFRGDTVFVRKHGEAWNIATIAAWDSPAAIAAAKDRVQAYYKEIGFDVSAATKAWGVTMQRTICEAAPQ
ncbi:MAG TPA: ester cyclase [Kofleriaceae bacterium]|jgi:predicted ester cyclase